MHFDKAGDTKACFFILTFPVVAGLGSVQQSVSHIKIVRLTETCSLRRLLRENFCSCSGSHHLLAARSKKNKKTIMLLCTVHAYVFVRTADMQETSCYVADDTIEPANSSCLFAAMVFIAADGSAEEASLWQHCAFCIQRMWLLGNSWCWEKNQDYFPSVNKTELFTEIL